MFSFLFLGFVETSTQPVYRLRVESKATKMSKALKSQEVTSMLLTWTKIPSESSVSITA
jgi:hypothetical protein